MSGTRAAAPPQNQARSWGIAMLVLGLVILGFVGWRAKAAFEFATGGVAIEGRLTGIESVAGGKGRTLYYARLRYRSGDGELRDAVSENRITPAEHRIGEVLKITYLAADPARVRLAAGAGAAALADWFLGPIGLLLFGAGAWLAARRPA